MALLLFESHYFGDMSGDIGKRIAIFSILTVNDFHTLEQVFPNIWSRLKLESRGFPDR